ncbi:hypothetical protein [Iningainema tapete]|uniref:hypothetical protein n=1 Tax=Iningainema tapete TaxID=2806730 RepID=UPI00192DFAC8|nr:hypothetical protein [Iningainema tapete]
MRLQRVSKRDRSLLLDTIEAASHEKTLLRAKQLNDVITSPFLPNFVCEVARLFVSRG